MILETIKKTGDIKKVPQAELDQLAAEIRNFLLEKTSKTGGHLAANLGVVELTMALHLALDLPNDKIVWDVGHQSYTHKILTGRAEGFDNLRQLGGMSGFPKRHESNCDAFDTGHSSTSISAALGMAHARDILKEKRTIVAVIGDGSMSGGMAFEALNNASELKTNLIIILNDNNLSISPSVGGMSRSLTRLRTSEAYNDIKTNISTGISNIPMVGTGLYNTISNTKRSIKQAVVKNGMVFEEMDVTYLGPYDGHNILKMVEVIKQAKKVKGPVLIHVHTKKGKGYEYAENNPSLYHGIGAFDIETGEEISKSDSLDYTTVFGNKLISMAEKNPKIVAITAAMAGGTGLLKFSKKFKNRFFDVGIAEEHAVTFAAGMAASGLKPFVAIYSSFLQRAYDQILHDVCLQDLPVVFAIDRAGLTGPDGETHHGIFDISYLTSIPGLTVMAPKNSAELEQALEFAAEYAHPIAIRYPKGCAYTGLSEYNEPIVPGVSEKLYDGADVSILAYGSMVKTAVDVCKKLQADGISAELINLRFAQPLDKNTIIKAADKKLVVTLEENVLSGGIGQHIAGIYENMHIKTPLLTIGVEDEFVCQGTVSQLHSLCHIDAESIANRIREGLG